MAKSPPQSPAPAGDPSGLETRLGLLAEQFARDVLAVIRGSRLDELLAVAQPSSSAAVSRRAADALSLAAGATPGTSAAGTTQVAERRRRRRWPTCGEPGCSGSYYPASGTAHLCYKHFIASGGRHPNSRK